MSQEIKLDVKDKKILAQLDLNSRQSLQQIAKKVGLSKQVVAYRIKRLENEGIIAGYVTVMDTTRLGFLTYRIYVKIARPSHEAYTSMIEYLKKHKDVAWVIDCYGHWDLCFVYLIRSLKQLHDNLQEFLNKYRDHVLQKDIAIMAETYYFRRAYITGETRGQNYDTVTSPPNVDLRFDGDKTDWEILRTISANARAELLTIGQKVGLSPKAVSYRIKAMQKNGIIQSFRTNFDVTKFGYEYYKIFLKLTSITREKEKELFTWLQMHPNVVFVTKPVGEADYEFEFQARGREDFWKVIDELRKQYSQVILSLSTMEFAREYKFLYLPDVAPV